jgi:uncharacterized protein (DUF3084 family)
LLILLLETNGIDYQNPLHCWLMLFWKSHELKKSPKEVLEMYPQLQEFAKTNTGYGEFCQRYNLVAADRDTLKQYALWLNEIMRREGEIEGAREDEAMKWQEALADKDAEIANKDAAFAATLADKDAEIADKDAEIADKDAEIADKDAEIADKDAEIADKDAEIADKDAEIAALKARLEQSKGI